MNKPRAKGLKTKLLMLTLVPATLVGVILFFISANKMKSSLEELSKTRVGNLCNAIADAYNELIDGDWEYDGTGFLKGDTDLYGTYSWIDSIYDENGVHVTLFYGDTRIMTTVRNADGTRFVNTQAGETAIETVLRGGQDYFSDSTTINGENYYAYYIPARNSDGAVVGMIFAGVPSESVQKDIRDAIVVDVIALIVLLVITVAIVIIVALDLIKTIKQCADSVVLLETGSLNVHARTGFFNRKDELAMLAESINSMASRFRSITGEIKNSSDVMKGGANTLAGVAESTHTSIEEVSRAIEDVANGATSQASDTQEAVMSIETMSESLDRMMAEVNGLASAAGLTQDTSKEAEKAMEELIQINLQTSESVKKIVDQSEINVNAAARIQEVVNVISDIASQTNLLSLNASIEAARAGEQGKGFGVVALEVGKLAEDSSKSAAEIEKIIVELVENISETSDLTTLLNVNAKKQIDKLHNTQKDFNGMLSNVKLMFDKTLSVKEEIRKINEIRKKIEEIIENLSALSEENAASSEETTASTSMVVQSMEQLNASSQEMTELATKLAEIISYFH